MRVYKRDASVIRNALSFWKAENLVTAKQADKLSNSLEVIGFDWRKLSIFIILSSILFFVIASAAFIDELARYFENDKIVVCFAVAALDILFYVLGTCGKSKWPEKFYSNEGLLFLGVLFTPCAILMFFIVSQENEIKFDITGSRLINVILISFVIYSVLGTLLKSKLIWCFSLIAFGQWLSLLGENDYYLGLSIQFRLLLYGSALIALSRLLKSRTDLHRMILVIGLLHLFTYFHCRNFKGNLLWHKAK